MSPLKEHNLEYFSLYTPPPKMSSDVDLPPPPPLGIFLNEPLTTYPSGAVLSSFVQHVTNACVLYYYRSSEDSTKNTNRVRCLNCHNSTWGAGYCQRDGPAGAGRTHRPCHHRCRHCCPLPHYFCWRSLQAGTSGPTARSRGLLWIGGGRQ